MTKVERLRPEAPGPLEHQCEARIEVQPSWMGQGGYMEARRRRARARGRDPLRCTRRASYRVDGELLCAAHAGRRALDLLLKMKTQPDFIEWDDSSAGQSRLVFPNGTVLNINCTGWAKWRVELAEMGRPQRLLGRLEGVWLEDAKRQAINMMNEGVK